MIEAHDLPSANPKEEPYGDSQDYTTRVLLEQNEGVLKAIRSLDANIERLSNFMPRQLSKEAPTMMDLGPLSGKNGAGTVTGVVWQTTTRWRVATIIIGGAAGDNIRLKIGVLGYNFVSNGQLVAIPFEIEVDRGVDINVADITTPAATAWTFMLSGYPE